MQKVQGKKNVFMLEVGCPLFHVEIKAYITTF